VVNASSVMPDGMLTLAEILKNKGYCTYFFNGGNAFLRKAFNFNQGFDIYRYLPHRSKNATNVTDEFLAQIPKEKNKKFFAYLHYMDAHTPYTKNMYNNFFIRKINKYFEPGNRKGGFKNIRALFHNNMISNDDKEYIVSLYDGQIRFVDENIKRILDTLQSYDILEETIIIITSDHGEEFFEHNNFEHGHTMYNELLHIPLLITGKNIQPAIITEPVRLLDLLPTILELTNIGTGVSYPQGVSLLGLADDMHNINSLPIFAAGILYGGEKYCLIKDDKKIIFNTENIQGKWDLVGYTNPNRFEFYDIHKDPLEKESIPYDQVTMAVLKKDLDELKNLKSSTQVETSVTVIDEDLKERLKSLGYIQ
jgi:arylsulfatase A-like enzyme